MTPAKLYIWIVSIAFVALTAVMLLMPRSTYSELEKRDLAEFPKYSPDKIADASYAKELSSWFSDTEPYRDEFMSASMKIRDLIRYSFGDEEEAISFHKGESKSETPTPPSDATAEELEDYENHINADENAKIGGSGIVIVGSGPNVRALNAFGGEASGGTAFANAVSEYQREIPGVKVYAMVIPLSSEFYMPDKAKSVTKPQQPFIKNVYSNLKNGARGVNAYNALADHVNEPIYLRTDHHWAPLGAFYAAQEFARAAGVPFKPLSSYTKNVIHGFVGSMYGYSNDIAVKNAPEDFIFYTPNGINYTTTYRIYDVNRDYQVTRESAPIKGEYFFKFHDGNGNAYSTFMGGDQKLTKISTGANTGRKLIVIKDSYGNALPGYLFYSFDEIHVVDFRYFTHNIKKYAHDNGITDIVFCVNVFNAYSSSVANKIKGFLTRGEGVVASPSPQSATQTPSPKGAVESKKAPAAKNNNEEKENPVQTNEASQNATSKPSQPAQPDPPVKETPAEPSDNNLQ